VSDLTVDPIVLIALRFSCQRILAGEDPFDVPSLRVADFDALWLRASSLVPCDDLALRVAREVPVGAFGLMSYAAATAPKVGAAIKLLARDHLPRLTGIQRVIERAGANAIDLVFHSSPKTAYGEELIAAVITLRLGQLAVPPAAPSMVGLARPHPTSIAPWEDFFGVVPRYGERTFLRLPRSALERPLRTADAAVQRAIGGIAETATLTDEVRAYVRQWIHENPSEADVARALAMSRRTLQRRLAEQQSSFRKLLLEVRIEVAKQWLARPDASMAEVARAVGIERAASFTRLFRSQVGTTPRAWRSAQRG
jgi:AraC-like DNA-binding protein